jgi:hypothetical protein
VALSDGSSCDLGVTGWERDTHRLSRRLNHGAPAPAVSRETSSGSSFSSYATKHALGTVRSNAVGFRDFVLRELNPQ